MVVLRALTVTALCAAHLFAAPDKPSAATEKALRTAVSRFYTLIVEKKFRAAEAIVAKDSKDDYYVGEKPSILDFKIDAIKWDPGFHRASVSMVSKTRLRRAAVGEFEVTVPYLSHWVFERGGWYWFAPKVDTRSTPFGTMKIDPQAAAEAAHAEVDLKKLIAGGPKPSDLFTGVHVSPYTISKTGSQEITVENTLTFPVTLKIDPVDGKGFSGTTEPATIAPHTKATLTIHRDGAEFAPGRLLVTVEQTGQLIYVAVQ